VAVDFAGLESLWVKAGGDASDARTAAAVATAESSGNPGDVNSSDPSGGSFGLWQLNGVHKSDMEAAGLPKWQTDPLQNAEGAVMVWKGQKKQWFTSGGWYAEGPNGAGHANYLKALADNPAGPTGIPWFDNTPGLGKPITIPGDNAAAAAPLNAANAAAQAAGKAVNEAANSPSGILGSLQKSSSAFWTAHPAWLVLAGIVLLGIAWSLVGAPSAGSAMPSAEVRA
jgi:hypothetical protein